MTCRELIGFLMDYLDGELPTAQRREFEHHLDICPDCRAYLGNYRETVKAGKAALAATEDQVPETVPEGLVQAILAARRGPE